MPIFPQKCILTVYVYLKTKNESPIKKFRVSDTCNTFYTVVELLLCIYPMATDNNSTTIAGFAC